MEEIDFLPIDYERTDLARFSITQKQYNEYIDFQKLMDGITNENPVAYRCVAFAFAKTLIKMGEDADFRSAYILSLLVSVYEVNANEHEFVFGTLVSDIEHFLFYYFKHLEVIEYEGSKKPTKKKVMEIILMQFIKSLSEPSLSQLVSQVTCMN